MKPDFSPAQMQEMAETLLSAYGGNINRGVYAAALRQAASQAAEIERQRELYAAAQDALVSIESQRRALESRLLALREQVEGIRGYFIDPTKNTDLVWRADVLALFYPAQEKG